MGVDEQSWRDAGLLGVPGTGWVEDANFPVVKRVPGWILQGRGESGGPTSGSLGRCNRRLIIRGGHAFARLQGNRGSGNILLVTLVLVPVNRLKELYIACRWRVGEDGHGYVRGSSCPFDALGASG